MLRRPIQLLTLTLLSSAALAVPRAEANTIFVLPLSAYTCTDSSGGGVSCSPNVTLPSGPPADLLDSTNINFELIVDPTVVGNWKASIKVTDSATTAVSANFFSPITSAGTYYVPFAAFNPGTGGINSFSTINKVELTLSNLSGAMGDSIVVRQFAAVPEPGTAGMLTLGLLGLAAGSPRRRLAA
jgi:hypothetical protein